MRTIVIGGGASGMMSAVFSADYGETLLLEKNEKLGKKLYITGKGRCNLTNSADFADFFNNVVSNPKFLYSAIKKWGYEKTIDFFEENGLPTKIERGNRVFPLSDKSSDVIKTLSKILERKNVKVHLSETVIDFVLDGKKIVKVITDKGQYSVDKVILATGGLSYPATGSTGDGLHLAKKVGHTIITCVGGLVPIILDKVFDDKGTQFNFKEMPKLQGLSLKNVRISVVNISGDKCYYDNFGELIFTSNGISGPLVLSLSSYINRIELRNLLLKIDLKPALDKEKLDIRFLRDISTLLNKNFKNFLNGLLPASLIPFFIELTGIMPEKKVCNITKEEREKIIFLMKNLTFTIKSLDKIDNAIITSGGVDTKEINPKNMQSKIIDNLYFAGEIIDVDALTGGFNLQIAFATAYAGAKE